MIYISHRGNLNGRNIERENDPIYITKAIQGGFNVEIDVWYKNNDFYLGHDMPLYRIPNLDFLKNDKLWCHAKNIDALNEMLKEDIHCFWHQEDDVTLTSKGYMWTYPGKKLKSKSIVVDPENYIEKWWNHKFEKISGICSNYIERCI
jgi:hypothetical protein